MALQFKSLIILMGVSGSGKTTIGTLLAARMAVTFADADDYHSAANKQKMASGHPLTDEDRQPWLESLNGVLRGWVAAGVGGVLACSALKETYRQTLTAGLPADTVDFVLLDLTQEEIADRMATRHHEFMSPTLLASQFATLEVPSDALPVGNSGPPDEVVQTILEHIHLRTAERNCSYGPSPL